MQTEITILITNLITLSEDDKCIKAQVTIAVSKQQMEKPRAKSGGETTNDINTTLTMQVGGI